MSTPTTETAETSRGQTQSPPPAETRPMFRELLLRLAGSSYWIVVILVGIVGVFSALAFEQFATVPNVRNIATDVSILLVMAVGATYVIVSAGIDLSVGSVLVFSGVVGAKLMEGVGGNSVLVVLLGLAACLASGMAWGVFNGFLIARAQIPALIATLGTLGMALGLAQVFTNGIDVREVPGKLGEFGTARLADEIPYIVIVAAAVALVGGAVLAATRFGRYSYAIGSNTEAARREGINVELHLIKVYGLAGVLSGLAGFLSLARFSTTTIAGHSTDVLHVVAGVVLGGTSLFGGVGTMFGTVVGMLIPAVLQNGFVVVGVEPFWQQVAVGAVLIVAVYLDQLRRRFRYRA
jgi:ribose transport system permease protein